ncbi:MULTISPECIES: arsenate reductase ArsC [unclassified Endozoicomonas]|uniref:arsenate reductase ArsC n=1 Tax=unclassified Endozoicomonas TaxID=2644528 RepID=UPI002148AC4C|nr:MULTISPECIES: arsenate reductase ArsC [unclassified Endozoicomonas]
MMDKTRILFLCTGNSCRSQMAEGWARNLLPSGYETFSAGLEAHGLNPSAVRVMQEAGIDISQQLSQTLEDLNQKHFDFIITVCDHAHKTCPTPKEGQIILKRFDDPPRLAKSVKTEEESLAIYRRVRDEIRVWVNQLPDQIQQLSD